MKVTFTAFGHQNILATHKTTFELTADSSLSRKGDCIIGVGATIPDLSCFANSNSVKIKLSVGIISDIITATPNPDFKSQEELVVRLGEFVSDRTFATRADKAAIHLDRRLFARMKSDSQKLIIEISDETKAT